MRMMPIASGSSGNCIYLGTEDTHVLFDAGISRKRIEEGLNTAGLSLKDIDAIFITHEHIDIMISLNKHNIRFCQIINHIIIKIP